MSDIVAFRPRAPKKPTEADIKADIRAHCAAVVALMQKPAGHDDLHYALHLADHAYTRILGLMITRGDMP